MSSQENCLNVRLNPANTIHTVEDPIPQLTFGDAILSSEDEEVILVDSQFMKHAVKEPVAEFIFRGYLRFHWKEVINVEECSDGDLKVTKAFPDWDPLLRVDKHYMYFLDVRPCILEKIISYASEYAKVINSSEETARRSAWRTRFLDELDPRTAYELALAAHYYDLTELKDLADQKVAGGRWRDRFNSEALRSEISRREGVHRGPEGGWKDRSNSEVLWSEIRRVEAPSYLARRLLSEKVLNSHRDQSKTLEALVRSKKQGSPYVLQCKRDTLEVEIDTERTMPEEAVVITPGVHTVAEQEMPCEALGGTLGVETVAEEDLPEEAVRLALREYNASERGIREEAVGVALGVHTAASERGMPEEAIRSSEPFAQGISEVKQTSLICEGVHSDLKRASPHDTNKFKEYDFIMFPPVCSP